MKKQPASKPKAKQVMPKTETSRPRRHARSLEDVVGPNVYKTWVDMLHVLVPDGRTHRLAPLVAAMLQYALAVAEDTGEDEDSVAAALLNTAEAGDPAEVKAALHDVVTKLFKDAGVGFQRTSARGEAYSIADDAYEEYLRWYDMPWE